jgi:hypothetical protein
MTRRLLGRPPALEAGSDDLVWVLIIPSVQVKRSVGTMAVAHDDLRENLQVSS